MTTSLLTRRGVVRTAGAVLAVAALLAWPRCGRPGESAVARPVVSPQVRVFHSLAQARPDLLPPRGVDAAGFVGSARFSRELQAADVAALEKAGVEFLYTPASGPVPAHIGNIYPIRAAWHSLPDLEAMPALEQLDCEPALQVRSPLNVTRALAAVPALTDQMGLTLSDKPGEGVKIADFDSGIDPFHPAFFRADGGWYRWIDVDGDGALTFGTDACDLDRDRAAGPGETLRFHDVTLVDMEAVALSWDALDPDGKFTPGVDWVYADTNGNGKRDFGPAAGFGETAPGFGEPVLLVDDVDQDGVVDPDEKLVLLRTSKIARVMVKGTDEYIRGKNLSTLDPHIFPSDDNGMPGASHGTGVAGILAGNTPRLTKYVGIAPYADIFINDHSVSGKNEWSASSGTLAKLVWARDLGVKVVLIEYSSWGQDFIDGTANIDQALDQLHDKNQILFVVPAGNLGGSGKHMSTAVQPGQQLNLGIEVPKYWPDMEFSYPFETPYLFVSLYWYGQQDDLSLQIIPAGQTDATPVPANMWNPVQLAGGLYVQGQTSESPNGLVFRLTLLHSAGAKDAIPAGKYFYRITSAAAAPVVLHAYLNDAVSSWGRVITFDKFETADSTICNPATANTALAVGAYGGEFGLPEELGKIRPYSGRGPRIDGAVGIGIAAPDDPMTPLPDWSLGMMSGNKQVTFGYMIFGGTSGAGPHVAGVAALLKQLDPSAGPDDIAQRIRDGATVEPSMGALPNKDWGHGKLNAYKAWFGVDPPDNLPPSAHVEALDIDEYTVVFDAGGSADPDGGKLLYRFDYDYDGEWDTGWAESPLQQHSWPAVPGRAVAKLAVRDDQGAVAYALLGVDLPGQYAPVPDGAADAAGSDGGGMVVEDDRPVKKGGGGMCSASRTASGRDVPSAVALLVLCLYALLQLRRLPQGWGVIRAVADWQEPLCFRGSREGCGSEPVPPAPLHAAPATLWITPPGR